jgi:hypothetical protein
MRCFICRLLLIGALGFALIFILQAQLDLKGTFDALSSFAVLAIILFALAGLWTHLKQWRRPLVIAGLGVVSIVALAAVMNSPELQQFVAQLLSGVSLEGPLPLVFAVLCIITYGILGIARTTTSPS